MVLPTMKQPAYKRAESLAYPGDVDDRDDESDIFSPGSSKFWDTFYECDTDDTKESDAALAALMEEGSALLKQTHKALKRVNLGHHPQTRQEWTAGFRTLTELSVLPSTHIAICGTAGAGKSSLLNALLGYAILPVSPMRACTSSPVEMSYGEDGFRADVVFMSREEWMKDLNSLAEEVNTEAAASNDYQSIREDAEQALLKLRAVYPELNLRLDEKSGIGNLGDPDDRCNDISELLGHVEHISASDAKVFSEAIAPYIESSEVNRSGREITQRSFWPLIKLVKIRCASPVLRAGTVLVDLPGLGDRSAAREAVTRNYIKDTKYIWIVASITRAVDNKQARDLLGEQFRSQLMMGAKFHLAWLRLHLIYMYPPWTDGNYNDERLSFVLTKTDNGALEELVTALGLNSDPTYQSLCKQVVTHRDVVTECKRALQSPGCNHGEVYKILTMNEAKFWDAQSKRLIFATNRRSEWSRKELQAQFREGLRDATRKRKELALQNSGPGLHPLHPDCRLYSSDPSKFDPKADQRGDLSVDLAAYVSGLHFQDYGKVNLRVFACSAWGFSRLTSQDKSTDDNVAGICFKRKEDTGIPALREHGRRLGASPRSSAMQEYFGSLKRLLGSIESHATMAPDTHKAEREALRIQWNSEDETCHVTCPVSILCRKDGDEIPDNALVMLNHSGKPVAQGHSQFCLQFRSSQRYNTSGMGIASKFIGLATDVGIHRVGLFELEMEQQLKPACQNGATVMSTCADDRMRSEGNRIKWNAYQNVIRNDGVWRGDDLNSTLVQPCLDAIAPIWGGFFGTGRPNASEPRLNVHFHALEVELAGICEALLTEVVDSASIVLREHCESLARAAMNAARISIHRAFEKVKRMVINEQKAASRTFHNHVKAQLRPTYRLATQQKGVGAFLKQKKIMEYFTSNNKEKIFIQSVDKVFEKLGSMIVKIQNAVKSAVVEAGESIERIMSEVWVYTVTDESQRAVRARLAAKIKPIQARVEAILSDLDVDVAADEVTEPLKIEEGDLVSLKI